MRGREVGKSFIIRFLLVNYFRVSRETQITTCHTMDIPQKRIVGAQMHRDRYILTTQLSIRPMNRTTEEKVCVQFIFMVKTFAA